MNKKHVAFFFILLGISLDNLSVSAGFTLTQSLERQLREDYTTVSWVVSVYSLTLGSCIILVGKLGDVVGLHRVFFAGLVVLCVSTLVIALVPKVVPLIVFRAIQGVAGAALIPTGMGLTASYFQGKERALAMRLLMLTLTTSAGIGTVFGGAFSLTAIGYRAFFFYVFGASVLCLGSLSYFMVPVAPHKTIKLADLDYVGALCLVGGLLLVILGLTEAGSGWSSAKAYVPIPVGVAVVALVAVFEIAYIGRFQRRVTDVHDWRSRVVVLFPRELGTVRLYVISCCASLFYFCAYSVILLSLIQFHERYDRDSPLVAALRVLPISVGIICGNFFWRVSYTRKVDERILIIGATVSCICMSVWASRCSPGQYWRYELVSLLLLGASTNVFYQIVYTTILVKVPLHLQANGSGIFQTFGQVGIALGSAATASIVGGEQTELDESVKKCFYLIFACYAMVITMYGTHLMLSKGERNQDHEMQLDGQPLSGSSLK